MIFIGERVNAGFKDIKAAIENKDGSDIRKWARIQADKNATYIDVNLGTASSKPEDLCSGPGPGFTVKPFTKSPSFNCSSLLSVKTIFSPKVNLGYNVITLGDSAGGVRSPGARFVATMENSLPATSTRGIAAVPM